MKSNPLISILLGLSALTLVAILDFQQYNMPVIANNKSVIATASPFFNGVETLLVKAPNIGVPSVNILFFESERIGTGVVLFWDATDELELVGYQVEKSVGNGSFKRIGWVYSREISREPSYEFVDNNTFADEPCFYRLKMVDFDGAEAYSPIISAPATDH